MHEPPKGVSHGRLYSLLTETTPQIPITLSLRGIGRVTLAVRALCARHITAAREYANDGPPETRADRYVCALVAASLFRGETRAFRDPDELGGLTASEIRAIGDAVLNALGTCSPTYASSDAAAWATVLDRGAREHLHDAMVLGGCVDVDGASGRIVARPDLYWGKPLREITDGQWMACRAARRVYEGAHKGRR